MRHSMRRLSIAVGIALLGVAPGTAFAQSQTKSTEVRKFQVVSVDGNKVVIREQSGTRELTVPPDFRFTVDGKQVSVAELKPGMTGTATITTTTTVKPVHVTEVRNGEVVQASGNSLLVRTPNGYRMFSPGDIEKRNITIMKDGKPVDFSDLRTGDRLSATVITEGPPQVLTQRQVEATLSGAPGAAAGQPAAAAPGAAARPSPSVATAPGAPPPPAPPDAPKRLPKTAGQLPLLGVIGVTSLAMAGLLTALRRRRMARQ
jgi:hypothetical protein